MKIGDCLSILGGLEYFQDKVQINIHKLRIVDNFNEEMLQYQQTMSAQKCYFDPSKPFQRRLFNESWQKDNLEKKNAISNRNEKNGGEISKYQNNDEANKKGKGDKDVVEYTLKRVMKNLNNFILNDY